MQIYRETNKVELRTQPWTTSNHNSPGRYYDFRRSPELIRSNLEEFHPYGHYSGVESFYSMIEWLNGTESPFETNDARLTDHMSDNTQREIVDKDLVSILEFGVFFRDLNLNLVDDSEKWSFLIQNQAIEQNEIQINPNSFCDKFLDNLISVVKGSCGETCSQVIGVGTAPLYYKNALVSDALKHGTEFIIRAWLWGNDENEIFDGLQNVVNVLKPAMIKSVPT